jgi:hypothetical protein
MMNLWLTGAWAIVEMYCLAGVKQNVGTIASRATPFIP